MKNLRLLGFLLLSFYAAGMAIAQDRAMAVREKLLSRDQSRVLVVAHRGDWRNAPENSLLAIEFAIRMGVDMIELDVQRTKDGQFILMHDSTLDRTTSGKGKVADKTLAEIRELVLRKGHGAKSRFPVPTLEEALLLIKGKVLVNLDKADKHFEEIYPLLEKTGTVRQIIMKGKKPADDVQRRYGKYFPDLIYMPIINLGSEDAEEQVELFMKELNPVAFEFGFKDAHNPVPARIKERFFGKTTFWYNTLWASQSGGYDDDSALENPEKIYGYLINTLGARIIQTDRPEYLLDYLRKKGLHD